MGDEKEDVPVVEPVKEEPVEKKADEAEVEEHKDNVLNGKEDGA